MILSLTYLVILDVKSGISPTQHLLCSDTHCTFFTACTSGWGIQIRIIAGLLLEAVFMHCFTDINPEPCPSLCTLACRCRGLTFHRLYIYMFRVQYEIHHEWHFILKDLMSSVPSSPQFVSLSALFGCSVC